MTVQRELKKLGLTYISADLGMVAIMENISKVELEILNKNLKRSGLELTTDKKEILVEKIKAVIIKMIHFTDEVLHVNDSEYIIRKLGRDYNYIYISNTFSKVKGMTIQQYIILQKIEKVKELLIYNELTLTEIAYQLHYSSVAHLSYQFKKITGHTPTYFKEMEKVRDRTLDEL